MIKTCQVYLFIFVVKFILCFQGRFKKNITKLFLNITKLFFNISKLFFNISKLFFNISKLFFNITKLFFNITKLFFNISILGVLFIKFEQFLERYWTKHVSLFFENNTPWFLKYFFLRLLTTIRFSLIFRSCKKLWMFEKWFRLKNAKT